MYSVFLLLSHVVTFSSVSIVPRLWAGWLGFDSCRGRESFCHCIQTRSEAFPTSYWGGTRGPFPGGEVARVWSQPLNSIWCWS